MKRHFELIDKPTFFGALALLFSVIIPLLVWPSQGEYWIGVAKTFMTDKLGFLYLGLGLAAFFFMVYIIFSDIGQIKLGDADEKPEFATGSWAAMLFCGGIGASILYWGTIEWAYYYQNPPFQLEAGSEEAIRWAATYGIFHWGPIAWSIYLIPALPIAYFFYVRKQPVLKISAALMPVIGEARSYGKLGKVIDVLFIFGLLGGAATTLGLAAPLINEGISYLFGIPSTTLSQIGVLLLCTALFAYSSYKGMDGGIKVLSNINFWGALALLAFILVTGPTLFMLETGLDSIGRMLSNFFVMATWAEPFGGYGPFEDTHFPQDWTIFYWAWWLVFAPSMGLFVARISRGRTIKQMVSGSIFFGSMGCALYFMVLGNFGLSLQLSGQLDVVAILNQHGATRAIFCHSGTTSAQHCRDRGIHYFVHYFHCDNLRFDFIYSRVRCTKQCHGRSTTLEPTVLGFHLITHAFHSLIHGWLSDIANRSHCGRFTIARYRHYVDDFRNQSRKLRLSTPRRL